MDTSMDIPNGFDDHHHPQEVMPMNNSGIVDHVWDNSGREMTFSTEKLQFGFNDNDLFLSLKCHIDSQQKLIQLYRTRIRTFEKFRKYCQRFANFDEEQIKFDLEQFLNEYQKFDRNYRYGKKRIRKLQKQTKSSLSSSSSTLSNYQRYQNPYDTLYDLFTKIESFDRNNELKKQGFLPDYQMYPEISINVPVNNNNNRGITQSNKSIQCDPNDFIENNDNGKLIDLELSESIAKTKSKRGRKPAAVKKQTTTTAKTRNSVNSRQSKTAQSSKRSKITTRTSKATAVKNTPKRKLKVKQETTFTDSDLSIEAPPVKPKRRKRECKIPVLLYCDAEGCHYSTTISSNLKLHKVFHSDERPFQCDKCDLAFKMKGDLKRHQNIHEGKRFACTVEGCSVSYSTQRRMRKHVKIFHTKEAPLLHCNAEGCVYSTYNSEYLKIHRKIHAEERPFKCPDCELAFKSASNLWSHKLKHQSERRFKCSFEGCPYSTYNKEYLQNHQVIHTGDRPYKCIWPECEQSFKTSSGLWSHKMIHENQRRYKCPWEGCEYAGNLWRNLHKHEEAMHGKKKLNTQKNVVPNNNQTMAPIIDSNNTDSVVGIAPPGVIPGIPIIASRDTMINYGGGDNNNNNNHSNNVQTLL